MSHQGTKAAPQSPAGTKKRHQEKASATCAYLENGSIHLLVVVLLPGVLPRDAEHGFLLVLPDEAGVLLAVDLLDQPLPQPPAAVAVTHPAGTEGARPRQLSQFHPSTAGEQGLGRFAPGSAGSGTTCSFWKPHMPMEQDGI